MKREALKAFQCASTVKAVLKNTGMLAGAAFADILETVRRFFTPIRFVQAFQRSGKCRQQSCEPRFAQHDFSVR